MQVTETLNDGLKRGYRITVPGADLTAKVDAKLAEAAPGIEMKGFRKGKVPMALLKKQFGERLLGEAMQEVVDGAMSAHFDATGDRPAAQPELKMEAEGGWKEGDDLVVALTYERLPEVPEVDFAAIRIERLTVSAGEASVTEALENLAKSAGAFDDRKKGSKAKDGDQVVIDFTGKLDGEPFDGGAATDYPLVLGSNSFIPGFEDQLVGAKAGDEVAVNVTFPDGYQAANLAGKAVVFDVTVKAVKAPAPAAIDDELAKKYGAETLDAFKAQIAERLEAEYKSASRAVMKRALLDRLDAAVSFDLPQALVDAEAGQIAHQLWHEEHPDHHGHDHAHIEPTDEHMALAKRRVKLGLLLAEIGRKAEVQVTDAELTQAVLAQARQYPGQERQFFEFIQKNPGARQQIQAPIFEDKVVDHVFGLVSVTETAADKDALQKAVAALDEM
jgi:trigger factor